MDILESMNYGSIIYATSVLFITCYIDRTNIRTIISKLNKMRQLNLEILKMQAFFKEFML